MQKVCPNCRQVNPPDAMFCRQCASTLGAAEPNPPQYANPPQYQNQPNFGNQPDLGNQRMQQNVPPTGTPKSNRAMISAGLAVLALFCCGFFTGIPAAILGWLEIQAIKEGKAPADGMMMAQIGLWLGIGGTVINAIVYIIFLFLSALAR